MVDERAKDCGKTHAEELEWFCLQVESGLAAAAKGLFRCGRSQRATGKTSILCHAEHLTLPKTWFCTIASTYSPHDLHITVPSTYFPEILAVCV